MWYLWLVIGLVAGFVATIGGIMLGTVLVMRNDKLSAYFMGKTMKIVARKMMG